MYRPLRDYTDEQLVQEIEELEWRADECDQRGDAWGQASLERQVLRVKEEQERRRSGRG